MQPFFFRKLFINTSVIVTAFFISTIFVILLIEGLLRWQSYTTDDYNGSSHPGVYAANKVWGWNYIPNYRFVVKHPEFTHEIRINALGFRGGEDRLSPRAKGRRKTGILLGDSFMFGMSIPRNDLFVERISEALKHYTWYNFSASGWGTINQFNILKHYIDILRPRIVMIAFFENDFFNNTSIDPPIVYQGYLFNNYSSSKENKISDREFKAIVNKFIQGKITAKRASKEIQEANRNNGHTHLSLLDRIKRFFHVNTLCYAYLEPKVKNLIRKVVTFLPCAWQPTAENWINNYVKIKKAPQSFKNIPILSLEHKTATHHLLKQIKQLCLNHGVQLKVFLIPSKWLIDISNNPYIAAVIEILQNLSIDYFDLTNTIKNNGGKNLYWEKDGHLRPGGHELMVKTILETNWFKQECKQSKNAVKIQPESFSPQSAYTVDK